MKRHNKKRNTAFLYEVIVREMTRSIMARDSQRVGTIKVILKEHFSPTTAMGAELACYDALLNTSGLDKYTAEKMIHQSRAAYGKINQEQLFREQSVAISAINKGVGPEVYQTFVPNYRAYATVSQIFGAKTPVKARILLEQKVLEQITSPLDGREEMSPLDGLVVSKFTERFNSEYKDLLPEQQTLLEKYILSFNDHGADFRFYLSEELKRVYTQVKASLNLQEVSDDTQMVASTNKILQSLSGMNVSSFTNKDMLRVLKVQQLVRECQTNAT
jgi:hypothetical protein